MENKNKITKKNMNFLFHNYFLFSLNYLSNFCCQNLSYRTPAKTRKVRIFKNRKKSKFCSKIEVFTKSLPKKWDIPHM